MRHPGEKTARQMVIQTEETEFAKQRSENSQATVRKQRVIPNYYRRLSGGEQERQDWGYGQDLGRGALSVLYRYVDFPLLTMKVIETLSREVT